jgi:cellulose synthase/poly-beta-1,6-N-acetylglucosamine synthase-like glycosyltransferase
MTSLELRPFLSSLYTAQDVDWKFIFFDALGAIALLFSVVLLIPTVVLLVECLAAVYLPKSKNNSLEETPAIKLAVLVPAHNEATVIGKTLKSLLMQLQLGDRVVVIADNCNDKTAAIARSMEVEVIERHDNEHLGKGHALDFGLQYLQTNPPEVVVMVDADCDVQPGAIHNLANQVYFTGYPAQAVYLLTVPTRARIKDKLSLFAFKVKNMIRPIGLMNLRLPCLLTGTGMAFPWTVFSEVSVASQHIVEDMQLTFDMAITGYLTQLCPDAIVLSSLPQNQEVAKGQRIRWEHGHLNVLQTYFPKLVQASLKYRSFNLLALALELSIPPLTLLVGIQFVSIFLNLFIAAFTGFWLLPSMAIMTFIITIVSILTVWLKFGKSDISLFELFKVPLYFFWKMPIYIKFLIKPQTSWNITKRDA